MARISALFLSLSLDLSNSAFGLRVQNPVDAGMEEKIATALGHSAAGMEEQVLWLFPGMGNPLFQAAVMGLLQSDPEIQRALSEALSGNQRLWVMPVRGPGSRLLVIDDEVRNFLRPDLERLSALPLGEGFLLLVGEDVTDPTELLQILHQQLGLLLLFAEEQPAAWKQRWPFRWVYSRPPTRWEQSRALRRLANEMGGTAPDLLNALFYGWALDLLVQRGYRQDAEDIVEQVIQDVMNWSMSRGQFDMGRRSDRDAVSVLHCLISLRLWGYAHQGGNPALLSQLERAFAVIGLSADAQRSGHSLMEVSVARNLDQRGWLSPAGFWVIHYLMVQMMTEPNFPEEEAPLRPPLPRLTMEETFGDSYQEANPAFVFNSLVQAALARRAPDAYRLESIPLDGAGSDMVILGGIEPGNVTGIILQHEGRGDAARGVVRLWLAGSENRTQVVAQINRPNLQPVIQNFCREAEQFLGRRPVALPAGQSDGWLLLHDILARIAAQERRGQTTEQLLHQWWDSSFPADFRGETAPTQWYPGVEEGVKALLVERGGETLRLLITWLEAGTPAYDPQKQAVRLALLPLGVAGERRYRDDVATLELAREAAAAILARGPADSDELTILRQVGPSIQRTIDEARQRQADGGQGPAAGMEESPGARPSIRVRVAPEIIRAVESGGPRTRVEAMEVLTGFLQEEFSHLKGQRIPDGSVLESLRALADNLAYRSLGEFFLGTWAPGGTVRQKAQESVRALIRTTHPAFVHEMAEGPASRQLFPRTVENLSDRSPEVRREALRTLMAAARLPAFYMMFGAHAPPEAVDRYVEVWNALRHQPAVSGLGFAHQGAFQIAVELLSMREPNVASSERACGSCLEQVLSLVPEIPESGATLPLNLSAWANWDRETSRAPLFRDSQLDSWVDRFPWLFVVAPRASTSSRAVGEAQLLRGYEELLRRTEVPAPAMEEFLQLLEGSQEALARRFPGLPLRFDYVDLYAAPSRAGATFTYYGGTALKGVAINVHPELFSVEGWREVWPYSLLHEIGERFQSEDASLQRALEGLARRHTWEDMEREDRGLPPAQQVQAEKVGRQHADHVRRGFLGHPYLRIPALPDEAFLQDGVARILGSAEGNPGIWDMVADSIALQLAAETPEIGARVQQGLRALHRENLGAIASWLPGVTEARRIPDATLAHLCLTQAIANYLGDRELEERAAGLANHALQVLETDPTQARMRAAYDIAVRYYAEIPRNLRILSAGMEEKVSEWIQGLGIWSGPLGPTQLTQLQAGERVTAEVRGIPSLVRLIRTTQGAAPSAEASQDRQVMAQTGLLPNQTVAALTQRIGTVQPLPRPQDREAINNLIARLRKLDGRGPKALLIVDADTAEQLQGALSEADHPWQVPAIIVGVTPGLLDAVDPEAVAAYLSNLLNQLDGIPGRHMERLEAILSLDTQHQTVFLSTGA